jgi:hypothetical protein
VASLVEMGIYRGAFILSDAIEMFSEAVSQTSTSFAYVRLFAAGANNGINDIARHTGEAFPNCKSPLREGHRVCLENIRTRFAD